MTKNQLHNELKLLALCAYEGNDKFIPKGWAKIQETSRFTSGFSASVFAKNKIIVIAYRGSEGINDYVEDYLMWRKKNYINQFKYAFELYRHYKRNFGPLKIILTGHSLGGSLAQMVGGVTGEETVTFNAYGIKDVIEKEFKVYNSDNITNYGNINDRVFRANNHIGKTYVIGAYDKLYPRLYHDIETLGNISTAREKTNIKVKNDIISPTTNIINKIKDFITNFKQNSPLYDDILNNITQLKNKILATRPFDSDFYQKLCNLETFVYRYNTLISYNMEKEAENEIKNIQETINLILGTWKIANKIFKPKYMWVTEPNACQECQKLDGKTFERLEDIPSKPHPHCKCKIKRI